MTASSTFLVTAFPDLTSAALDELAQIDSSLSLSCNFKEGVFLVETGLAAGEFVNRIRTARVVFVRHLAPVQAIFPLSGERTDLAEVTWQAEQLWRPAQGELFEVQCRTANRQAAYSARDVEVAVGSRFESLGGVPVLSELFGDHDPARIVVSIYLVPQAGYLGVSRACHNSSQHSDPQRLAAHSTACVINRAEFKLREALASFEIQPAVGEFALDIGAAPGGWSLVLSQRGLHVTALDPAVLHPLAAAHPRIRHVRMKAADYTPEQPLDWLLNDMGSEPGESVEVMLRFSNWLKPGGAALMTLKLYRYNPSRLLSQVLPRLGQCFSLVRARSLFFNRREVTIFATNRESSDFMA